MESQKSLPVQFTNDDSIVSKRKTSIKKLLLSQIN